MEPVLQYFKKFNPHAAEKSVWSANKKDEVVTFCVEVPSAAKTKNDLSAQDLLEYVKTTQQNWVAYGKRKSACTQPWLSHNVSNTINVRPDEWEIVGDFIYKNRKYFAGVSLLPASGDLDYPQAPFCNVLNAKEILQEYGEGCLLASGLIVDGLHAYGDLWEACNYAVGLYMLEKPAQPEDEKTWELKNDWIRRVRQFAMRYCDGNIKKCTYMLKHVNNWKTWLDLTKEYKEVDYTQFLEDKDYTKPMDTIACAGGKCELN
jgi:ribonucleoside-diphosphate reductase alpha chain